jgi:signal transduction histidine kinase
VHSASAFVSCLQWNIHNIEQHLRTRKVYIHILVDSSYLRLIEQHDGIGFVKRIEANHENGLLSLKNGVSFFGADIQQLQYAVL